MSILSRPLLGEVLGAAAAVFFLGGFEMGWYGTQTGDRLGYSVLDGEDTQPWCAWLKPGAKLYGGVVFNRVWVGDKLNGGWRYDVLKPDGAISNYGTTYVEIWMPSPTGSDFEIYRSTPSGDVLVSRGSTNVCDQAAVVCSKGQLCDGPFGQFENRRRYQSPADCASGKTK